MHTPGASFSSLCLFFSSVSQDSDFPVFLLKACVSVVHGELIFLMWCDMGLKIYFFPINFPVDLPLFIARTTVFTLHCGVPSVVDVDQTSINCVHSG